MPFIKKIKKCEYLRSLYFNLIGGCKRAKHLRAFHENNIFWYIRQPVYWRECFVMMSLRWRGFRWWRLLLQRFYSFNLSEWGWRYNRWSCFSRRGTQSFIFTTRWAAAAWDFFIKTWWKLDESGRSWTWFFVLSWTDLMPDMCHNTTFYRESQLKYPYCWNQ